jgi:hypothetical protein
MSTTLERPTAVTTAWHDAAPWVVTGVAALGELLAARGLCAGNPASNSGAIFRNDTFTLEPGYFRADDVQVRWSRHIGGSGVQNRACSREEWAALVARCRASLPA